MSDVQKKMPTECIDEASKMLGEFTESCIKLADKHNVDRDFLMQGIANAFYNAIMVGTFENYQIIKKENAEDED